VQYVESTVRNVTLKSIEITSCSAGMRDGGGLLAHSGTHVTLQSVVIANNSAHRGGGVCVLGSVEGLTPMVVKQSRIHGNLASEGAGIYFEGGTFDALVQAKHIQHKLSVYDTEIEGNVATESGGGLKIEKLQDDWTVHTHTGQELIGFEAMNSDYNDPDIEYDWPMEWYGRWTLSPDSRYVYST
jgi:hypothetical protein